MPGGRGFGVLGVQLRDLQQLDWCARVPLIPYNPVPCVHACVKCSTGVQSTE